MLDYYSAFRKPAYNSSLYTGCDMGRFDPMNAIVILREEIATALAANGSSPETSIELGGSPVLKDYATYLHETIHWWQHVGTTSGMHYGLCIPSQALTTIQYLIDAGTGASKPLMSSARDDISSDDPAVLAVQRWADAEFGAAILFSPLLSASILEKYPQHFTSCGDAIVHLMISNLWSISRALDPTFQGLQDPREWFDSIDRLATEGASCFDGRQPVEIALGMEDVFEGQARFCELQYLHRCYENRSWREIEESGSVSGVYGTAFDYLIKHSNVPRPIDSCDPTINLFLVLCDIASNPHDGYPCKFQGDDELIHRLHPGIRFMTLCHAVSEHSSVRELSRDPSPDAYREITDRLCGALGWSTPTEVAHQAVATIQAMSEYSKIASVKTTGKYGSLDVPIVFYFQQQEHLLSSKIQHPHFFCWPGLFLTTLVESDASEKSQELLNDHIPPFQSSSFDAGIDIINLKLHGESRDLFVSDYFTTQILYDFVRQWISAKGGFSFDYKWKGAISEQELRTIKNRFKSSFSFELDDIAVSM